MWSCKGASRLRWPGSQFDLQQSIEQVMCISTFILWFAHVVCLLGPWMHSLLTARSKMDTCWHDMHLSALSTCSHVHSLYGLRNQSFLAQAGFQWSLLLRAVSYSVSLFLSQVFQHEKSPDLHLAGPCNWRPHVENGCAARAIRGLKKGKTGEQSTEARHENDQVM